MLNYSSEKVKPNNPTRKDLKEYKLKFVNFDKTLKQNNYVLKVRQEKQQNRMGTRTRKTSRPHTLVMQPAAAAVMQMTRTHTHSTTQQTATRATITDISQAKNTRVLAATCDSRFSSTRSAS